jgi:hypothetical protein
MKWLAGAAGAALKRDKPRFRPAQQFDCGVETGLLPALQQVAARRLGKHRQKPLPPCGFPDGRVARRFIQLISCERHRDLLICLFI